MAARPRAERDRDRAARARAPPQGGPGRDAGSVEQDHCAAARKPQTHHAPRWPSKLKGSRVVGGRRYSAPRWGATPGTTTNDPLITGEFRKGDRWSWVLVGPGASPSYYDQGSCRKKQAPTFATRKRPSAALRVGPCFFCKGLQPWLRVAFGPLNAVADFLYALDDLTRLREVSRILARRTVETRPQVRSPRPGRTGCACR